VASGNSCHDFRPSASSRFRFCQAAEQKNAENLLVIQDPALASKYTVVIGQDYPDQRAYDQQFYFKDVRDGGLFKPTSEDKLKKLLSFLHLPASLFWGKQVDVGESVGRQFSFV
jgi:hypothetical protein